MLRCAYGLFWVIVQSRQPRSRYCVRYPRFGHAVKSRYKLQAKSTLFRSDSEQGSGSGTPSSRLSRRRLFLLIQSTTGQRVDVEISGTLVETWQFAGGTRSASSSGFFQSPLILHPPHSTSFQSGAISSLFNREPHVTVEAQSS